MFYGCLCSIHMMGSCRPAAHTGACEHRIQYGAFFCLHTAQACGVHTIAYLQTVTCGQLAVMRWQFYGNPGSQLMLGWYSARMPCPLLPPNVATLHSHKTFIWLSFTKHRLQEQVPWAWRVLCPCCTCWKVPNSRPVKCPQLHLITARAPTRCCT
jgi:hypothetical protein